MSEKLIDLIKLQEYKTYADAKYQGKLTAGNNISISGNTVSVTTPTFVKAINSGNVSVENATETTVGTVNLQPGIYLIMFTCVFATRDSGTRTIGISYDSHIDTLGYGYIDRRLPSSSNTQTAVQAILEVSASSYPNGRTFYFVVRQTCGITLTATPQAYYLKF